MILQRKDGLYAYQLAVVVDDAFQGITHVVRGIDLFDSTARQIYLFNQLNLTPPAYAHIPVITDSNGNKLSKQNHAKAIDANFAEYNLLQCLTWLNQPLPPKKHLLSCKEILEFSVEHWQPNKLHGIRSIVLPLEQTEGLR
jgi:glutamyl-Q tRNA(Asp) synthetase